MAKPKTPPKAAPLLCLTTLVKRPKINIDGTGYEILSPDELSILDAKRLSLCGEKIAELTKDPDSDANELEQLVSETAKMICVGVPADIFDKLKYPHMEAIIAGFSELLLDHKITLAGAIMDQIASTGGKSSHGSSAFTAATRTTGSRARRSQS